MVVKGLRDESGRRLVALLWLLPRRWSPHLERIAGAGPEATWRGGGPFPPCCCATLSLRAEERSVGAVGGAAPPPCPRNILAAVVGHRCGPALANRPEELHVALRIRTVHHIGRQIIDDAVGGSRGRAARRQADPWLVALLARESLALATGQAHGESAHDHGERGS